MGSVGFFFDENFPPVIGRAFGALDLYVGSRKVAFHNYLDRGMDGQVDEAVFEFCGREELVLITHDKRIRFRNTEKQALLESGITVIEMRGEQPMQELFRTCAHHLPQMLGVLKDFEPKLYVMKPKSWECKGPIGVLVGGAGRATPIRRDQESPPLPK